MKNFIYKILRYSERYTKTDMIYLSKGGFWLTFGQGVSILSAFLLSIAFANLLPKETYGNYKYILSIAGILAIPTLSGMNTALTQSVARGFDGSLFPVLKIKIKWGTLGSLASLVISAYYYLNGNEILAVSFLIASFFMPFMDSLLIYSAYLNGKKDFKNFSKYSIITKIIDAIIIAALLYSTDNLLILIFTYFLINTSLRLIFFKLTAKNIPSENLVKDPETISYGWHLSLMNIISTVAGQLDKILVYHYLGAVDLAIYSFATVIPENIKGVFKNINALAFPKFSEKTAEEIKKTIFKKMAKLIIIAIFITIIYIILAPFIFKLIFPQYTDAIFYSQIFSISIILLPITGITITALQSQKAKKELYQFNIYSSIIEITVLFVMVYFYNLIGIILARIISRIISGIFSTILLNKNSKKATNT